MFNEFTLQSEGSKHLEKWDGYSISPSHTFLSPSIPFPFSSLQCFFSFPGPTPKLASNLQSAVSSRSATVEKRFGAHLSQLAVTVFEDFPTIEVAFCTKASTIPIMSHVVHVWQHVSKSRDCLDGKSTPRNKMALVGETF